MFVDEPDVKIAEVFAKDLPLIQADIDAGRVLYVTALEPHKEGWWGMLQEFSQICNTVIKKRTPFHARLLLVYDEPRAKSLWAGTHPTGDSQRVAS